MFAFKVAQFKVLSNATGRCQDPIFGDNGAIAEMQIQVRYNIQDSHLPWKLAWLGLVSIDDPRYYKSSLANGIERF
jgi:hypothetical protein